MLVWIIVELWWSKYNKIGDYFVLNWSILCRPAFLHKLPICNNTHGCGSPYVDKACTIHTWIQSGHMHVNVYTQVHTRILKVHMHMTHMTWVLWWSCGWLVMYSRSILVVLGRQNLNFSYILRILTLLLAVWMD